MAKFSYVREDETPTVWTLTVDDLKLIRKALNHVINSDEKVDGSYKWEFMDLEHEFRSGMNSLYSCLASYAEGASTSLEQEVTTIKWK